MATFYNTMNIDLSQWNLYVSDFKIEMNDGMARLDVGMTSTMPNFEGYDRFLDDLSLLAKIKRYKEFDPAVNEAWQQLLTVLALKT